MNWPRHIFRRVRALLLKDRLDAEMAEEMRLHLELQERANRAAGMPPVEAGHAARRQFGGIAQVQELCRDQRGVRWLDDAWQDLRFGARLSLRSPGFTAVVVLTLALGIGLNTGIFSAFKAIALRPLPGVPDSKDLVALLWTSPGNDKVAFSYLDLRDFSERCQSFSALEGTALSPFIIQIGDQAQRGWGEYSTGGEQAMLGTKAVLGRLLVPSDDHEGGEQVAVISHKLWKQQLGSDQAVVGRRILVNGQAFTIVGVGEPGYGGSTVGFALDVFLPTSAAGKLRIHGADPKKPYSQRDFHWIAPIGRLKPGHSLEQARAEVQAVGAALALEHPAEIGKMRAQLVNLRQSPFGAQTYMGPMLGLMMGITALVLLIMCANVASLLLARATTREHEIAVRLAIGAGRWRVLRQLLTESALLALTGGFLGAMLALSTPKLLGLINSNTRYPIVLNAEPDMTVLLFALALSACSALGFGLIPALQASALRLVPALKGEPMGRRTHSLFGRNALVVLQVAIALPLLATAGLLIRSYRNSLRADFGFSARNVAMLSFDLGPSGYNPERGRNFHTQLLDQIGSLPGVESASLAQTLPLCVVPALQTGIEVDGYVRPPQEPTLLLFNVVSRDYFRTLHIAIVAGREFEARDSERSLPVAVVNETFASRYWPGANPLGRHFKSRGITWEVIGVARDIKYLVPGEAARPYFYLPVTQNYAPEVTLQIRGSGDPHQLCHDVQKQIAQLDPHLLVYSVETMEDYLEFALSMPVFAASGMLLAGTFGLLLTGMGTFGLINFYVGSRTREIGIRIALGATRSSVVFLVMNHGLRLAAFGIVLGLAVTLGTTRFVKALLYGVEATDLVTIVAALIVVAGTAVLATWLPARRATRIDPLVALRAE
jgi:predicted permease